jgi:hypothetical protein
MKQELQPALELAHTLGPDELPELLADLEHVRVVALSRILSPAVEARPDESLNVEEAASRLGVSADYVYRHQKRFAKFSRREGRKLLFSSAGLDLYIKRSR